LRKSSSISATSAVSMAVWVPAAAMATPISAYQGRRIVDAIAHHADD
jgi:hypothetical protein